jgi:hypothetical protein
MLTCRPRARASEGLPSSWGTDPLRASVGASGFSFDGTAEVRTACSADVSRTGTAERAAESKGAGAAAVLLDDSLTGAAEGRGTVTAAVLLTGTADDRLTGVAEGRGAVTAAVLLTGTADDSFTGAAEGDADDQVADASAAKSADRGLAGGGRFDPLLAGFMT